MKKQYIIFLLAFSLLGCKKPDSLIPLSSRAQSSPINTIRTLNSNGHWILSKHSYTSEGQLAQQVILDELTGQQITQHYFYQNQNIQFSDISNGSRKLSKIVYNHTSGILTSMQYLQYNTDQSSELSFQRDFTFINAQISKIATTHPDGSQGDYQLFTFQSGNVTNIKTFSAGGQQISSDSYNYDQHTNPEHGFPDHNQSAIGYSKSNIVKSTHTDYLNNNAVSTITYSYDYDSKGQPISRYVIGSNQQRTLQATYSYN